MERLTKRISKDCIELSGKCNSKFNKLPQRVYKEHEFWNVFEVLCNKEDAEEQGLSINIPCKMGSPIFAVETWDEPEKTDVFKYLFDGVEMKGMRLKDPDNEEYINIFGFDELGKTVFLSETKAQIEKEHILKEKKV